MNKLLINPLKARLARGVAGALIIIAVAVTISASVAQTGGQPKAQWPTGRPHKAAIDAFTAALSRSSWDAGFRERLMKSSDEAKKAVSEVGNIDIPDKIVFLFYPPGGTTSPQSASPKPIAERAFSPQFEAAISSAPTATLRFYDQGRAWLNLFSPPNGNENYHIFELPPLNESDRNQRYEYKDFLRGAYDVWWD